MDIIFLSPLFKERVWGGNKLNTEFGYDIPFERTGECWAVSAHPNGSTLVHDGEYEGMSLADLWDEHRELFGNVKGDRFPLLVKILDAKEDLSLQVHPDDEYAKIYENGSFGKTECWYVLDAEEGSSLVLGHNASSKEDMKNMIEKGLWDEFIREVPVKKGSFVQIDPGTIHAVKGGIVLLETQQNSDLTYRVYDYDRIFNGEKRELHIKKALDVTKVPSPDVEKMVEDYLNVPINSFCKLIECNYYNIWKVDVDGAFNFDMKEKFMIMSVVDGEGSINWCKKNCCDGEVLSVNCCENTGNMKIKKGDHFIIPYGVKNITLSGKMDIVASSVNCEE